MTQYGKLRQMLFLLSLIQKYLGNTTEPWSINVIWRDTWNILEYLLYADDTWIRMDSCFSYSLLFIIFTDNM